MDPAQIALLNPIVFMVSVALYLILRLRYKRDIYLAALEKGQPLPEQPQTDPRKPALVLIALGLGFSIASYVAVSYATRVQAHPAQVCIWGIVPIFIGVALLIYRRLATKDGEGRHPRLQE